MNQNNEQKPPSIFKMMKTFTKELTTWIKEGAPNVTPESYATRLDICSGCEHINKKARVTKAKFNPLSRTAIGDRIKLKRAATSPATGSQINISSSSPQTLFEATPPNTAAVQTPIPINDPWANVIWPANPETILIPHAPIEKARDLDISKIQQSVATKQRDIESKSKAKNQNF